MSRLILSISTHNEYAFTVSKQKEMEASNTLQLDLLATAWPISQHRNARIKNNNQQQISQQRPIPESILLEQFHSVIIPSYDER